MFATVARRRHCCWRRLNRLLSNEMIRFVGPIIHFAAISMHCYIVLVAQTSGRRYTPWTPQQALQKIATLLLLWSLNISTSTRKLNRNFRFMYAYTMGFMHEFDAPNHWATGSIRYNVVCTSLSRRTGSQNLTTQNSTYSGSHDIANVMITTNTIFVTYLKSI